jgi:group I intron endonuclease
MYGCIYKVTNLANNKIYIGLTNNFQKRYNNHLSNCFNKRSKNYNKTLYKAVRKYGLHNFQFIILGYCDSRNSLINAEQICIEHFQSNNKIYGYNNTIGGDGGSIRLGMKNSFATKLKQKIAAQNKIISDEQRLKLSQINKGKKLSSRTKEKMIQQKIGKSHKVNKQIINLITNKIFNNPKEAAQFDGVSYNSIIEICNNRQIQTKGFKYKYI